VFENEKRLNFKKMMESKTLSQFFFEYNTKYYGFKSLKDFCDALSPDSKIKNIKIPTIFLNAADDMFSPAKGTFKHGIRVIQLSIFFILI
jgi:predicted alpha/beta-fold hydrolase